MRGAMACKRVARTFALHISCFTFWVFSNHLSADCPAICLHELASQELKDILFGSSEEEEKCLTHYLCASSYLDYLTPYLWTLIGNPTIEGGLVEICMVADLGSQTKKIEQLLD